MTKRRTDLYTKLSILECTMLMDQIIFIETLNFNKLVWCLMQTCQLYIIWPDGAIFELWCDPKTFLESSHIDLQLLIYQYCAILSPS